MDQFEAPTRFYCHWDTHSEDIPSFFSELELDTHIRDNHFATLDEDLAQCHWDACHEVVKFDDFKDHYKNSHQEQAVKPHECCEPRATLHQSPEPYVRMHAQKPVAPLPSFKLPSLMEVPHATTHKCCSVCQWELEPGKICGRVFDMSQDLNAHVAADHIGSGKSNYVCKWQGCSRECRPFLQRQKIIRHLQTHARNCCHKCWVCGRTFAEEGILRAHLRTHSGERPYKCSICTKSFATSTALTLHTRTHTGEKPLVCRFPGCGKRFAESSNLTKHMRVHMERQYECEICKHKFTRRDQLQRHIRRCHDNDSLRMPELEKSEFSLPSAPVKI